ncbi:5'-3'-deoxyribonucleotidase [Psychrobacillus sp. OK032]|uniref:5' nucleotidase, NT5C type n=1 Tax=Psychrobacillus sp. OK032 TaxID=1884358 RepID=UPI002101A0F5|nr:5'-3'-deoxyribonucleotidase [Psychrobacillus sp. OK032]
MDEVISAFSLKCLQLFNADCQTKYTLANLHGKLLTELDQRFHEKVNDYLAEESFFLNLDVMEGSQEALRRLSKQYDIFIVTAAMEFPASLAPKYQWLKKHFPFLNEKHFVFCGDKSIICADYLIDDTPKNLDTFKGEGLLFSAPHNVNNNAYVRLNNWKEVEQYFL